jgi:hypothetical protein
MFSRFKYWAGDVAQAVEHLLCKLKDQFKPQYHKKKKIKYLAMIMGNDVID